MSHLHYKKEVKKSWSLWLRFLVYRQLRRSSSNRALTFLYRFSNVFSKKEISNSPNNMQTSSISPQNRTNIQY